MKYVMYLKWIRNRSVENTYMHTYVLHLYKDNPIRQNVNY